MNQADQDPAPLSVIVPARNGKDMTRNCLHTLLHTLQALQLSADLILIDDASDPKEGISDLFADIRRLATGHSTKIVKARSRLHYTGVFSVGLQLARGQRIFFLSNDMALTPHFLVAVLGVAGLSDEFGVVRGTSTWTDNHAEHIVQPAKPLPKYGDVLAFSAGQFEKLGLSFVEDRVLSGDAVLIKRSVIDRIGVMDCRFIGYFGDIDFGMRAHLAGFKLVCAKGAWLHHIGSGHIKVEANHTGKAMDELTARRMDLVQEAYEEFRRKWDPLLPPKVADVAFDDYNAFADRAPLRPPIKCDFQSDILKMLTIA